MKKILLTLTTLLSITSFAGVITVSNNPINPGQYTDLQDAIDDANPNDTILVHGSNTSYGDITINSPVTIIGSGYNNPNGLNTTCRDVDLRRISSSLSPNGTRLIGIISSNVYINGISGGSTSLQGIDDIIIERSDIKFNISIASNGDQTGIYSNIMLKNCLLNTCTFGYSSGYIMSFVNIQFVNNVFGSSMYYNNAVNNSDVKFTNNTFVRNTSLLIYTSYTNVGNPGPIFENNIFYRAVPSGCDNCTFNNNITYSGDNNELIYSGNPGSTGGANLIGQDPQFVDFPLAGANFDYSQDLNLEPSSPAIGTGVAGADMGITGGFYPFDVGANPAIPQMLEITTPLGSSVSQGTNLNVTFKSYKQD